MASQYRIFDVSGAVQTATNWLLKQANEVYDAENLRFDVELGSAVRRPGYSLFKTLATSKFPLGFFEAKFPTKLYIMFAYNNAGNTATVLSAYDPLLDTVTVVKNDYPPNCKLQMVMNARELYVAGITTDTGARQALINVNESLTVSNTRNIYGAPKAAFIGENSGTLYAMNVELNGTIYQDRAYVSSPQKGAITYVNAAMNNTQAPVDLIGQVPVMTSATAPSGVAADSQHQATWDGYKIFKRVTDRTGGSWFTNGGTATGWVSYDFGSGNSKIITHYMIAPLAATGMGANDPTGAPRDWQFQGSNDNSTWSTLHSITAASPFTSGEQRTYQTTNTTAYRYYRINITNVQHTNAPGTDQNWVTLNQMQMFSMLQSNFEYQIKVDSARYIKPGLTMDIYKAGTSTLLYTVTPTSVDKSKDTFNFLPYTQNITSVNTTTDLITVPDATKFPTGSTIIFNSTGAVPTGLTANVTYYSIQIDGTTIKVAGSLSDAKASQPIDLTGSGSGTMTIGTSYVLAKTDELWLQGRQGDVVPSILWNTDYRTPQTADFIFIASGKVADTAITGWAKSNNRLNIFTKTSMWQYDNANFLPIFEDIGCISHDTICNNSTWIIWLDATGKVRARDSNAGQDQIISRAMKNRYLGSLTASNLQAASAVMFDSNYKLDIGTFNGKNIRLVYNFDMNNWWRESHKRRHVYSINSSISGVRRNYFLDENGLMFLDEDTDLDYQDTIPWYIRYGRLNFGTGFLKSLIGLYLHTDSATGSVIEYKTPGKSNDWLKLGQIDDIVTQVSLNDSIEARDFDIKIHGNAKGTAARIDGIEVWYDTKQSNF